MIAAVIESESPEVAESATAEHWAPLVAADWRASVAAIVATGRRLLEAKAACGHGEYGRLFSDHRQPCEGHLPFSSRTGQRLVEIAEHPVLSDPSHGSDLPASWRTLAELARVEPERLERELQSGLVSPEMTRSQATAMYRDPLPPHRMWELSASPERLREHEFERLVDRAKELLIRAMCESDRAGDYGLLIRLSQRVHDFSDFLTAEVSARPQAGQLVLEEVQRSGRWPEW
jgi:hypothetical protein